MQVLYHFQSKVKMIYYALCEDIKKNNKIFVKIETNRNYRRA